MRRVLDKPGKDLGNVTGSLRPGVCLFGTATISAGGGAAVRFEYRGAQSRFAHIISNHKIMHHLFLQML